VPRATMSAGKLFHNRAPAISLWQKVMAA